MNFGPVATLLTLLVFTCVIVPCNAQTNKIFQWQFGGSALSQNLPSCRPFPITVKPFDPANNTHGKPPFYMMAFAVGGIPTVQEIGTDESALSWTVDQPIGTKMLLTVVDSQGSSGGVPPGLFAVVAGQSTQCIKPEIASPPDPPFTVTANVSDTLNTCQPWGLTIKGGTPPYNVTLAAINSPIVTNATLGPADDAFTYINRADPGTQLIAAISDLNGRWAQGVPIVNTQGSKDVSCTGLVSSSGIASEIKAAQDATIAADKSRKRTAVTAGVVVSLLVILLLAGAGIFLYIRRRKTQQKMREITPRQFEAGPAPQTFEETGGQILSINAFISPPSPNQPRSPKSPVASTISPSAVSVATPNPFDGRRRVAPESIASSGMSIRNPDRPAAFTRFPTVSVRRSAKEIEAFGPGPATGNSLHSYDSGDSASVAPHPPVGRSRSAVASAGPGPSGYRGPARSASMGTPSAEIIYQHEDAGVVRELPPPYADRGPRTES